MGSLASGSRPPMTNAACVCPTRAASGSVPFMAGGGASFDKTDGASSHKVHIRVQMRTGKKSITTVTGLDADLDLLRILRTVKKAFSCNGNIVKSEEHGDVLQLQGDHRKEIEEWLYKQEIYNRSEDRIVVHGF